MKKIFFQGTVFSGRGKGKKFVALPWVKQQIKENTCFEPYLGTLNIKLSTDGVEQKKLLETTNATKIKPAKGYCSGNLISAHIGNLSCAIIIPQIPNYPKDVIEIIAPVELRKKLGLKDGDSLTVEIRV